MSADSRSPITDALATLGMIHTQPEKRDAIHLGVEPVEAGETLNAGQHVCLINGKAFRQDHGKPVGIVDPFLPKHPHGQDVLPGQRFWLIVYPRQITSLRHVWEHPDFPASGDTAAAPELSEEQFERAMELVDNSKAVAKAFINSEADRLDISYDELIEAATDFVDHDEYLVDGGKFESKRVSQGFWEHYQIITGKKVPADQQHNFLSCAC